MRGLVEMMEARVRALEVEVEDAAMALLEPQETPNTTGSWCFTTWGATACGGSYTQVLTGVVGGAEAWYTHPSESRAASNVECVSGDANVLEYDDDDDVSLTYRLMRSAGAGFDTVSTNCSICCLGGCYVALGTTDCAEGYYAQYEGHVGGVELWNREVDHGGAGVAAKTLCVDDDADGWSSLSSDVRLMRADANGADVVPVNSRCAACCYSAAWTGAPTATPSTAPPTAGRTQLPTTDIPTVAPTVSARPSIAPTATRVPSQTCAVCCDVVDIDGPYAPFFAIDRDNSSSCCDGYCSPDQSYKSKKASVYLEYVALHGDDHLNTYQLSDYKPCYQGGEWGWFVLFQIELLFPRTYA
ncbi:hypothetical protein CTAYLR_005564, partial [Chrysophaeum taylorii]